MSRLIDADELLKRIPITHADEFQNCRNCSLLDDWEVENLVDDAPTIVEFEGDINKVIVKGEEYHRIVRCKDCKHWYSDADTGMACEFTNMGQPEDGYCNWAERRSDDGV